MSTMNSFSDLKKIGKALKEQQQRREEEIRLAKARESKRQKEAELFQKAMKDMGVSRISHTERAADGKPKPNPLPRQTVADNKAVLASSLSDEVDSLIFLQSEDGLCFWREGLPPDICRKLRRGDWTVQNHIDLHGLRVDPARNAVMQFLKSSEKAGARCVRIVHGKGFGSVGHQPVLKDKVRRWLKQCGSVMAFAEAPEIDGGSGAVLVLLRGRPKTPIPHPTL